jgi:hypothetical protein
MSNQDDSDNSIPQEVWEKMPLEFKTDLREALKKDNVFVEYHPRVPEDRIETLPTVFSFFPTDRDTITIHRGFGLGSSPATYDAETGERCGPICVS